MTGKKGVDTLWSRTSIAIRQDILKQALVSGLDINEICNQALASATGIHYAPPGLKPENPPLPVIVVKNGPGTGKDPVVPTASSNTVHPVINADDPRAASAVKQAPRPPQKKVIAALPGRVSVQEKGEKPPQVSAANPAEKTKMPVQKKPSKAGKEQAIKRFIADTAIRGDTEHDHVTKEELYQAFTRWCREHRITPVPDRKAVTTALKNKLALKEKILEGEPVWVNIRLQ
jgi:hypothetical protein